MFWILYHVRKFKKQKRLWKSLKYSDEMLKYDKFVSELCSLNNAVIKKSISCINAQNPDIISTQIYTDINTTD